MVENGWKGRDEMRFGAILAALVLVACNEAVVDAGDTGIPAFEPLSEPAAQSEADIQAGLPPGFTLYPDANVVMKTRSTNEQGNDVAVLMNARDAPAKVEAFYRAQAQAAGFEARSRLGAGPSVTMGFGAESGASFSLSLTRQDNGGTGIRISSVWK